MFGQGFNYGFISGGPTCFTDTTDIFKDNSGVALYTLDYDASDAGGASGKFNEGAIFNGSSSKITLPSSGTTPIDLSTENWTVSLWFKQNARAATTIFSKWGSGTANVAFIISVLSSDNTKLYIGQKSTSGATTSTIPSQSFDINVWNHLVVTRSSTQTIVYLNNIKEEFSTTNNVQQSASTPFIIGAQYGTGGGTSFFNGSIDQVRLFNRTISTLEAATLYNETKNTTNTLQVLGDTSCIATYTFDGSSTDLSGNYSGTDTNIIYKYDGTPTAVDFGVGGKSNYGARFNGSSSKIVTAFSLNNISTVSLSGWVNINSFTSTPSNVNMIFGTTQATNASQSVQVNSNGTVRFRLQDSTGENASTTSTALTVGQWHHLAVTWNKTIDSGKLKIYIDGTEASYSSTGTQTNNTNEAGDLVIGNQTSLYFDGSMDQIRIFNKAISAAEVSKLYGNGEGEIACAYTSTTDNIALPITNTAYYKLDNNSKDSARSTGKFNEGAIFNGSSSKITIPNVIDFSTGEHTISAWVYFPSTTLSRFISNFYTGTVPDGSIDFVWLPANNKVLIEFSIGGANYTNEITGLTTNTWYHIVGTFVNNGTCTAYLNGSLVDTVTAPSFTASSYQALNLGYYQRSNAYWEGKIDQVRIYNTALSSTDVSNLYAETASDTNTLSFPSGQTAIATYQLDGNSTDLSGNYNGTDTNITYAYDGTESNIEYRFGRFGQAAVFNGSSRIGTGITSFTNNLAISMWLNPSSVSSNGNWIFGNWNSTSQDIYFYINSSAQLVVNFDNQSGGELTVGSAGDFVIGNWIHFVVSMSSGNYVVYLNGVSVATHSTPTTSYDNGQDYEIGNVPKSSSVASWNGLIDQVRIYDAALTSSQVTELYNERPEVDTSNFKTVLYTGNGGTQYISNVGFQPDLVWTKCRSDAYDHNLVDSVRGINPDGTLFALSSNLADEQTDSVNNVLSLDANGFTVQGTGSRTNAIGRDYVSWVWKGGGDAVSNTDGSITSQVSANTTAGFSIVKYTGNGDNDFQDVGTGLSQECDIVFIKNLTSPIGASWVVQRNKTDKFKYLYLNDDREESTSSAFQVVINTDEGTFGFTSDNRGVNEQDDEYIAYCWHSVSGNSQIGSYNGSSSTVTISTGFEPSLLIIKRINSNGGTWYMFDNKRSISPDNDDFLRAEDNDNESLNITNHPMFYSDRIEILSGSDPINDGGFEYIYMAFK